MTNKEKKKIIRITTVAGSLTTLLKGQLKYISSSDAFEVIAVSSNNKSNQLNKVAVNEIVRTVEISMTRKITPIKDLIAIIKLIRVFKREQPFIVHSHTPKAGTLSMIASWITRVPHRLHTVAGLPLVESTGFKRLILRCVEKTTYWCATKIYPNSFGLKEIILKENLVSEEKIKILANGSSNGIDTSHFSPILYNNAFKKSLKEKLKINESDFVFVFIGRLVKDKGINELVQAFDRISKENKQVKLVLVGGYEKELDPLLLETTELIESNTNIIEVGWANDVRPYFSISNILVFPSYREGFPNVVMQASAMELASIVTNINGCNEIIRHNDNGFIIPKKDIESLFKAMQKSLSCQNELRQMGIKSRLNMLDNYEQKKVWKAVLDEYNIL